MGDSLKRSLILFLIFFTFLFGAISSGPEAAQMTDYCMQPPFIVGGVTPNLLLMIDNSASMFDLAHIATDDTYCYDQTFNSAENYMGIFDSDNAKIYEYDKTDQYFYEVGFVPTCASSANCKGIAGQLYVLMNQGPPRTLDRFVASAKYLNWLTASKFDVQKVILTGGKYDPADHLLISETRGCIGRKFIKEATVSDSSTTSLGITFAVKGPANENNETAPSPGGQTFLNIYFGDYNQQLCQAAINAYIDPNSSNADIKKAVSDCLTSNTSEVAYCANWPTNPKETCTSASNCIVKGTGTCTNVGTKKMCTAGDPAKVAGGTVCQKNSDCDIDYGPCIVPGQTTSTKTLVTFNQTIQACWAYGKGTPIGIDEVNTAKNQCSSIFPELYTCRGGTNDGKLCTVGSGQSEFGGCPDGTCINGPSAIRAGSPALICSAAYTGLCAIPDGGGDNIWSRTRWDGVYNAVEGDYAGNECVKELHRQFCEDINMPPVIDPTDLTYDSSEFDNLPAIISDIGIEAQLNQPFETLRVRIKDLSDSPVPPSGLIQDFSSLIRMGAMSFNYNASASECGRSVCADDLTRTCTVNGDCTGTQNRCITPVPCPKVCSTTNSDGTRPVCSTKLDCPNPQLATTTCIPVPTPQQPSASHGVINRDGTKISLISDSVGNHSSGLIRDITNLRGSTWTPFAEGVYNAIGYFARTDEYTADPSIPGRSRTDLRINESDFVEDRNPSQFNCQDNNILLISDGQSTADQHEDVMALADLYRQDGHVEQTAICPSYAGSMAVDDLTWLARNRNIKTFSTGNASTDLPVYASEKITTYVVYTGADLALSAGSPEQCNPKILMQKTAERGGTTAYFPDSDGGAALRRNLRDALVKIASKAASGTAASVLASGEGAGANLIQALFFPKRTINNMDITWTGMLQNFWYYIDPNLQSSSIREDTDSDKVLRLNSDYIVDFDFSRTLNETVANLYVDANGDGRRDSPNTPADVVPLEQVKSLWEAGKKLFLRAPGNLNSDTDARKIYTNIDDTATLVNFDTANASNISPYLNVTDAASLIKYIRGIDDVTIDGSPVRRRTVTIDGVTNTWKLGDIISSTPKISSWLPLNLYDRTYQDKTYTEFVNSTGYKTRGTVFAGANDGMLHAFKLGKLGLYRDANAKASLGKTCLGAPERTCRTQADCENGVSCLTDPDLGKELWGFIPKNALPYLKYLANEDYCHLYYVDATPFIFDASIKQPTDCSSDYWECDKTADNWRTILVGSMRLGGACRDVSSTCTDCVKTPIQNIGYSAYFALDITDPNSPELLWEYANPDLGLSTTGPGIVRIGDGFKNGRWYAVLGSGPQGFVTSTGQQFTGITPWYFSEDYLSDKISSKLVVLDLRTGDELRTIDTGIQASYIGNLTNSPIDFDLNYKDDALYFGYTNPSVAELSSNYYYARAADDGTNNTLVLSQSASSTDDFYKGKYVQLFQTSASEMVSKGVRLITGYNGETRTARFTPDFVPSDSSVITTTDTMAQIFDGWINGGVLRLITKESINPDDWDLSTVIENIGPVSAAVSKLQRLMPPTEVRLFFGTGRFSYKFDGMVDDPSTQQRLFGIKDPCYPENPLIRPWNIDRACTATVSAASLGNATTSSAGSNDSDGWYINLDLCADASGNPVSCASPDATFRSERVMTDPLALYTGAVFFTTSSPSADACEHGGMSYIWGVNYKTGGTLAGTGLLRGTALVQVSTGAIEEVDLSSAFIEKGQRRTGAQVGLPPQIPPSIALPPQPLNKIIHMKKQ